MTRDSRRSLYGALRRGPGADARAAERGHEEEGREVLSRLAAGRGVRAGGEEDGDGETAHGLCWFMLDVWTWAEFSKPSFELYRALRESGAAKASVVTS